MQGPGLIQSNYLCLDSASHNGRESGGCPAGQGGVFHVQAQHGGGPLLALPASFVGMGVMMLGPRVAGPLLGSPLAAACTLSSVSVPLALCRPSWAFCLLWGPRHPSGTWSRSSAVHGS